MNRLEELQQSRDFWLDKLSTIRAIEESGITLSKHQGNIRVIYRNRALLYSQLVVNFPYRKSRLIPTR